MDLSLSGLSSGFDWKTFIDQIMSVQSAPITKLNSEKTLNINKKAALVDLNTKLVALNASVTSLSAATLFNARKASSTTLNSTWNSTAAPGTASGSYKIAVTQLATAARLEGAGNLGQPLSATNSVADLTIANLPAKTAISAGTFSVNGQKVTVELTDSLEQVFTKISDATSGGVTASYDSSTDKITLSGSGEIILGTANDTSNFLSALQLTNNGTATIASNGRLGSVSQYATLADARLNGSVTAVDETGAGSFLVNGVTISYNLNSDSLDAVLKRINQSGAGVTASYDGVSDRVVLANSVTGDTGIAVSEESGGLMGALGLTGGATLVRGKNAEFSINDGATMISASNSLGSSVHGIIGLDVTVDSATTQSISVGVDSASMRGAIETFIAKFNDVQTYIAEQSKTSTTVDGKVSTSVLSSNREVQSWADSLRSIAFNSVPDLQGTISRLESLGIDFTPGSNQLYIKNGIKLDTALREKPGDVGEFFQTASTGLAAKLGAFVTKVNGQNSAQQTQLDKYNADIVSQIATIQRRLDQQRAVLTSSFIAMETAQSQLQSQSDALTKAFATSTSK